MAKMLGKLSKKDLARHKGGVAAAEDSLNCETIVGGKSYIGWVQPGGTCKYQRPDGKGGTGTFYNTKYTVLQTQS